MKHTASTVDAMLAEARKRTGFDDFGGDDFLPPLDVLLRSIEDEAHLGTAGRSSLQERIVGLLANRLRVQHWLQRYPAIREERLDAPLVIVGFPRTGTTMLQRLLASDPRSTALLWWESRNPAPFDGWSPALAASEVDARIVDARKQTAAMLEANPDLAAVHPFDAEAPDEDAMLLEHSLRSTAPAALAHVPTYLHWHNTHDNGAAYRYLKRMLQFIQWQKRLRGERIGRWVLKAPEHMAHVRHLFEQFPDATVIQPHRDPVDIYPSLASMIFQLRRLASDDATAAEAADYVRVSSRHRIARLMEARRELPATRFVDIWYRDVMSDPLGQVEPIYERAGIELTGDARQHMQDWLRANHREQRPTHEYSLEQFGFDADRIREELAEYLQAFVIPLGQGSIGTTHPDRRAP